jgi:hypothetical protein
MHVKEQSPKSGYEGVVWHCCALKLRGSLVGARLALATVGANVSLGTNLIDHTWCLSGLYKISVLFDIHLNSMKLEIEPQD